MAQTKAVAKFWIVTSKQIENVLAHEKYVQGTEPTKDSREAHRLVSRLYCRYVQLCRSLGQCFDQTLQVQKREVIQQLLQAANKRMLELGSMLKEVELSDFIYVDGALQELHLIPDDVQAVRPCYFPAVRPAHLQALLDAKRLQNFASGSGCSTSDEESISEESDNEAASIPEVSKRPVMKRDRKKERLVGALRLIMAHEKARQARVLRTNFRMHPDRYYPEPIDEELVDMKYDFFFRPGQQMLFPVKRTVFNWDFQMKQKNLGKYSYYRPPGYQEDTAPIVEREVVNVQPTQQRRKTDGSAALAEAEALRVANELEKRRVDRAAQIIQRRWRSYRAVKHQTRLRYERSQFLGLFDDLQPVNVRPTIEVDRVRALRSALKIEFDQRFLDAITDEKARILRTRGAAIQEDITDFVRAWFRQWFDEAHTFDVIPEPFQGGTVLIVRGETLTPMEHLERKRLERLEKLKSPEQRKKEAEDKKAAREREKAKQREEKERLKELARQKRAREKKEGKTYDFSEPEFVSNAYLTLEETLRRYREDWQFVEELNNVGDLPIMEWITLEKFAEVHQELHGEVRELLKSERELLQRALCKDEKTKYKPPKAVRPPRTKKTTGKKRKEAATDLTADRSEESLVDELIAKGVIKAYRKRTIDEFVGDLNYGAFEGRNLFGDRDPPPGLGEIRNVVRSFLYGMGPLVVPKPKSICFVGPPGYGKTLLLEAICYETGSVLFDLSVETCAPIPPADMPGFLQLVLKVARLMQPSVLAIEDVHRVFYKQVPPQEAPQDPTKLGKYLLKLIVKQLRAEERILLVATTSQPWLAKVAALKQCFKKFVLIPRADYGSTVMLWQRALSRYTGVPRDFDLSALAIVTKGYAAGQILRCVRDVLGIRRRMQFGRRPLKVDEFLEHFLTQTPQPQYPLTDKEYDRYTKWHRKVDVLAKKRTKMIRDREQVAGQAKSKRKSN